MTNNEIETWTAVQGDGGKWLSLYEVSNLGRVRSLDRVVPTKGIGTRLFKGKMLTPVVHPGGYIVIGLCAGGRLSQRLVHRLVALSFLGEPPTPEHEAAHLDGVRSNCALSNVAWKTKVENAADKVLHGTNNEGETNHRSGVDVSQVVKIVEAVRSGQMQTDVAEAYGLPVPTVNHIMTGRTWSTVTGIVYEPSHTTVTRELVEEMGRRKIAGESLNKIAAELGVGSATVFRNYRKSSHYQSPTAPESDAI